MCVGAKVPGMGLGIRFDELGSYEPGEVSGGLLFTRFGGCKKEGTVMSTFDVESTGYAVHVAYICTTLRLETRCQREMQW